MFWLNTKRVLRAGVVGFWRNGFVSLASILVMVITLFVVGSLLFNNILLQISLEELKERVDINVYFVTDAEETDIIALQQTILGFPEVSSVEYISREQALVNFRAKHETDQLILQALAELGDNPLGASLNIKTKEPSQYAGVAEYFSQNPTTAEDGSSIIDKVNYAQNKAAIDRLTEIIDSSEKSNLIRTLVLILASIVVTFNTIRLAIYISKEEISVMRLVGANNMYIRGPFIVAGMIYGVASAILSIAIFYPVTYWFGPLFYPLPIFLTRDSIGDFDLFRYYLENFGELSLVVIVSGIALGIISSFLAVRRYLR